MELSLPEDKLATTFSSLVSFEMLSHSRRALLTSVTDNLSFSKRLALMGVNLESTLRRIEESSTSSGVISPFRFSVKRISFERTNLSDGMSNCFSVNKVLNAEKRVERF